MAFVSPGQAFFPSSDNIFSPSNDGCHTVQQTDVPFVAGWHSTEQDLPELSNLFLGFIGPFHAEKSTNALAIHALCNEHALQSKIKADGSVDTLDMPLAVSGWSATNGGFMSPPDLDSAE
jgi:hypothetical protein